MFLSRLIILEVGRMEQEKDFELSCNTDLLDEIKNTMCFLGKAFPDGIIPKPGDARVEYLKLQSRINLAKCLIDDEIIKKKPSMSREWIDLSLASYTVKCLELLVSSELDDINREIRFN